MSETQRRQLGDIQVLRAVAILLVLAHHLSLTSTLRDMLPVRAQLPFWSGVELFFVISGAVVTGSILSRPLAPLKFLWRRVFRLIPAIIVFLGVSYAALELSHALPISEWGKATFATSRERWGAEALGILGGYFINMSGATHYMNGAMWSLSVEFQFYAGVAVALAALAVLRIKPAHARWVLLALATALYLAVVVQRVGVFLHREWADIPFITYLRTWRMDFMLLGVMVATAPLHAFKNSPVFSPYLLLLPLVAAALSEDAFASDAPFLHGATLIFMGLCFAALIYFARADGTFPTNDGPLYRVMDWIGNRSFSIYLLHFPVLVLVWHLIFFFQPGLFMSALQYGAAQLVLTIAITFALADLCYRLIEQPGQALGKKLWS